MRSSDGDGAVQRSLSQTAAAQTCGGQACGTSGCVQVRSQLLQYILWAQGQTLCQLAVHRWWKMRPADFSHLAANKMPVH